MQLLKWATIQTQYIKFLNSSHLKTELSIQARIQRFKEVSQTDKIPGFPLAADSISRSTSVIICVELSTLIQWWLLISAKSVEDCILVKRFNTLKSGSHLPKKAFLFASVIALQKWWKMLFISSQKLVSFSRYLNFCLDFLAM